MPPYQGFCGPSNPSQSLQADCERLMNWYDYRSLLDVCPAFAGRDLSNVLHADIESSADLSQQEPAGAKRANLSNIVLRELRRMVGLAARHLLPADVVGVLVVVRLRRVFEVCQPIIALLAVLVIHVVVGWPWTDEGGADQGVDLVTVRPSLLAQRHALIPVLDSAAHHASADAPQTVATPRRMNVTGQAADAPGIAHFVSGFVSDHGTPSLHGVELYQVHSRNGVEI